MFKYLKLRRLVNEQNRIIKDKNKTIDLLLSEIGKRDQKIIEQQKRMRFFGIQIGNEEYEAEKLDFPSTIKL